MSRQKHAEGMIDLLIGDRSEDYGHFLGAPSIVRQRGWTHEGRTFRLMKHRLLLPGKDTVYTPDTLFTYTPGVELDPGVEGAAITYIYWRVTGRLSLSMIGLDLSDDPTDDEVNEFNSKRINELVDAGENDEPWEGFIEDLASGMTVPEDELGEEQP